MSPTGKLVINQAYNCTVSILIGLFWNWHQRKRCDSFASKNIQLFNEAVSQAKRLLMGNFSQFNVLSLILIWKKKNKPKQKGKPTHCLCKASPPAYRLRWVPLARQWVVQEVGLVHGGIFVVFSLQLSSCITEKNVWWSVYSTMHCQIHQRRGSNTSEVVSTLFLILPAFMMSWNSSFVRLCIFEAVMKLIRRYTPGQC